MTNSLSNIFKEFGTESNIIEKIQDHGIEVSRRQIIKKLLELGLILDESEISNKRKSRRETPVEEPENAPKKGLDRAFEYENIPIENIEDVLGRMKFNPNLEKTLKWLREEIEDEVNDRNEAPENEWVERVLITQDEIIQKHLNKTHFKSLLKSARFLYPNHEQLYWRIGTID